MSTDFTDPVAVIFFSFPGTRRVYKTKGNKADCMGNASEIPIPHERFGLEKLTVAP